MIGHISSIETMGLVDGPGVRFVVFLSKCNLRCIYCHNPETWGNKNSQEYTVDKLINEFSKYKEYYKSGGITFSGGEPLLQSDFLLQSLKKFKQKNIHTAIDTSGVGKGNYEEILKYTDLVILDIKAYEEKMYKKITGSSMNEFKNFLKFLNKSNKSVWIRQVIIPGINDTKDYIIGLKNYLKKIKNIEKIELLPYHSNGKEKYKKLNIPYQLENIPDLEIEKITKLNKYLLD